MGIGVETWQQKSGMFSQCRPSRCGAVHLSGGARSVRVSPHCALVIAMQLAIADVELNPGNGAKLDDIVTRIDSLCQELRDFRASLSAKIEDSMPTIASSTLTGRAMTTSAATMVALLLFTVVPSHLAHSRFHFTLQLLNCWFAS